MDEDGLAYIGYPSIKFIHTAAADAVTQHVKRTLWCACLNLFGFKKAVDFSEYDIRAWELCKKHSQFYIKAHQAGHMQGLLSDSRKYENEYLGYIKVPVTGPAFFTMK